MPFCKTCGTFYTKSLGVCPKCNAEEVMLRQEAPPPLPPAEEARMKKTRWLGILVGIPAMIAFIYLLYYIRKIL